MLAKKINDDLLYNIVWIMSDRKNYFSSDRKTRSFSRQQSLNLKKSIINPEVSQEGLEDRLETLQIFFLNFLYFGIPITASTPVISYLLGFALEISAVIMASAFYLNGVALISAFRAGFAESDIRRFKRMKKKNQISRFKINRLAEPKIYDLIPGVFISILFYHFVIFTVNF